MPDDQIFKTDNTPLAAYLITEGFSLLDIIFNGRYANFLFADGDPKLHELAHEFTLLRAKTDNACQLLLNYQELIKRIKREGRN